MAKKKIPAKARTPLQNANEKLAAERKRVRELESLVSGQNQQISALKRKKFKIPAVKKGRKAKHFLRVIVGDTHGCFVNKPALAAFLHDLKYLNPDQIVLLGDHLDCAGWLAKHHPFKTKQEARYSFDEDVQAANEFLSAVQENAPKADCLYIEGNHEERLEAFCVEATQGRHVDSDMLRNIFSPEKLLMLEERKIPYFRRTVNHQGLRRKGMIKLGHCYFVHGTCHAKNAADMHLHQHKKSIVFGHTHRMQQSSTSDVETEYHSWCPGCLCEFEPIWMHSKPTNWTHGYGIQIVDRDTGDFGHVNAAIVNGRSFILPMMFDELEAK